MKHTTLRRFFLPLLLRLSSKRQPHLLPSAADEVDVLNSFRCPLDIDLKSIHFTFFTGEDEIVSLVAELARAFRLISTLESMVEGD